jgi:hypothetical protein
MISTRGTHAGRRMLSRNEIPDPGTFRPKTARENTRTDRRVANAHWRVSGRGARCDINRNLLLEYVGPHIVSVYAGLAQVALAVMQQFGRSEEADIFGGLSKRPY